MTKCYANSLKWGIWRGVKYKVTFHCWLGLFRLDFFFPLSSRHCRCWVQWSILSSYFFCVLGVLFHSKSTEINIFWIFLSECWHCSYCKLWYWTINGSIEDCLISAETVTTKVHIFHFCLNSRLDSFSCLCFTKLASLKLISKIFQ